MRRMFTALGMTLAITWAGFAAAPAEAQVIVNGKMLNQSEINSLAHYTCGPDLSRQLLDQYEQWILGVCGLDQVMGHVKDRCPAGSRGAFKQGNMSREGRLYSPGELLR